MNASLYVIIKVSVTLPIKLWDLCVCGGNAQLNRSKRETFHGEGAEGFQLF